ncbi:MAG: 50S ribosomal protein L22 [Patescibacteria group bacterium]
MKANLQTYRQSPRKVRLLADLIRGKKVSDAIVRLRFADKRAAPIVEKVLMSAVANASSADLKAEDLFVKEVQVNQGVIMKRMMPRARGSGARINKRTSHISIILGDAKDMKVKAKRLKKVVAAKK